MDITTTTITNAIPTRSTYSASSSRSSSIPSRPTPVPSSAPLIFRRRRWLVDRYIIPVREYYVSYVRPSSTRPGSRKFKLKKYQGVGVKVPVISEHPSISLSLLRTRGIQISPRADKSIIRVLIMATNRARAGSTRWFLNGDVIRDRLIAKKISIISLGVSL